MAEPTNTPFPPSTPRSSSPVLLHNQPHPSRHAIEIPASGTTSASSAACRPPSRPQVVGSSTHGVAAADAGAGVAASPGSKPLVLHIGDPIKYNPDTYALFASRFEILRPSTPERHRDDFKKALAERRWGDFRAVFRPFWSSGGEMGLWDEELVRLLPASVEIFASAGAGFDWADVRLLGERGIVYCNSSLAASEAVADFTVALVISTFRHLPWCISSASANDSFAFSDCHARATAQSHLLRGQVLGLVGFGNIGQAVARRAHHGFGMVVHYYDPVRKSAEVERSVAATFHPTLKELLGTSDCVVLCAPAGKAGNGHGAGRLIDAEALSWFKPGGRLVNVARGSLVDEAALADALEARGEDDEDKGERATLSSAALDVHANEPEVNPRLRALAGRKVLLTCHNAGGTVETHAGFEELSMRNIMAVLGGGEAITPVNLEHLRS